MAVCGKQRKERTHQYGSSNRSKDWKPAEQTGPIDFDQNMRSTAPRVYDFSTDLQLPANLHSGSGNQDFLPRLPGHDYRMPNAHPLATQQLKRELKATAKAVELERTTKPPSKIVAPTRDGLPHGEDEKVRELRQKGHKVAPRWNAGKWFEPPTELRLPLQKDEGKTWNHLESEQVQGERKAQDRLMRAVRGPEDAETPRESQGASKHPLGSDSEEYYPGRGLVDAVGDSAGNDFQVRPTYLPDFSNPPPENGDSIMRMQRIQQVMRQRYAGRPGLISVFRSCALTKPGYIFPDDLQRVFDNMGIKVSSEESDLLIKACDKDGKGALCYQEFADMIYGDRVSIGGASHEPQERHVRHVTKTLVESLVSKGQKLGKAFCDIDPERRYAISRDQFCHALGSACNHISNQAIDFLWAAQFPGQEGEDVNSKCVDWRNFMSQLAHFSHEHRAQTPCCVQGRKRQYDLLQKTAPLTGGVLTDLDLNRPAQDAGDSVHIVADEMVHRSSNLPNLPREAAFLTPHYVEDLRIKAERVEKALPEHVPKARLQALLKNRERVGQDDLVDMLVTEMQDPNLQSPLPQQDLPYSRSMPARVGEAEVMDLEGASKGRDQAGRTGVIPKEDRVQSDADVGVEGGHDGAARLSVVKAEIQAWVATLRHDKDFQVDVDSLIKEVYRPLLEKKQIEYVNDGLNRQLRGLRPLRERPPNEEHPRYENYWQARNMMDNLNDAMSQVENSNGGKIKPSRVFKRLDMDGDGFITMVDLQTACNKYGISCNNSDLHAMFTAIDKNDQGSIDIGEFTRNYEVFQGNIMDNMMKPIKSVYHEGGVEYGGPVQEAMDARNKEILANEAPGGTGRAQSEPPSSGAPPNTGSVRSVSTGRSQMSRAGASIAGSVSVIHAPPASNVGNAKISDVIRSRTSQWKPNKAEIYNSMPKTRFGMTCFPDTRHVTEAYMPLSGSYLGEHERFKTTNSAKSIFAIPDPKDPQQEDSIKRHARNEYRVERIRSRQAEFVNRSVAATEASSNFDELKIARKALNQLTYERRVQASC